MRRGEIRLVINTPTNSTGARRDGYMMRRLAVDLNIPFIATIQAAEAAVQAIEEARAGDLQVVPLQEYGRAARGKRSKLKRTRSEEHTSELQSRGHLVC